MTNYVDLWLLYQPQHFHELFEQLFFFFIYQLFTKLDFDVFNALDLMENVDFLEKLKFGIGDGNLQYYIYNWRSPQMSSKEVGLVLQ